MGTSRVTPSDRATHHIGKLKQIIVPRSLDFDLADKSSARSRVVNSTMQIRDKLPAKFLTAAAVDHNGSIRQMWLRILKDQTADVFVEGFLKPKAGTNEFFFVNHDGEIEKPVVYNGFEEFLPITRFQIVKWNSKCGGNPSSCFNSSIR